MHLVAQADAGEKENASAVTQRVRATGPLDETLVTAAALHTQTTTAPLMGDRGGQYLLTVKANPPSLHPLLAHRRIDSRTIPGWPGVPRIGVPYAQQAARLTRGTVRRRTRAATPPAGAAGPRHVVHATHR